MLARKHLQVMKIAFVDWQFCPPKNFFHVQMMELFATGRRRVTVCMSTRFGRIRILYHNSLVIFCSRFTAPFISIYKHLLHSYVLRISPHKRWVNDT